MSLHEMQVMDRSGHLTVKWDSDKADEVAAARKTFTDMTAKGYKAFDCDDGEKGGKLDAFDPHVEEMILVPPIQGG